MVVFYLIALVLLIPPAIMATQIRKKPGWIFVIIFWFVPVYPLLLFLVEKEIH